MDHLEIKLLLNYLENNRDLLNSLQHEFLVSMKDQYKATWVLTKRQVECLYEIRDYILSLVPEEAFYESESDDYRAQYSSFDTLVPFNL